MATSSFFHDININTLEKAQSFIEALEEAEVITNEDDELDIDHDYTDEIVCPWCGCEYTDSWECKPDEQDIGLDECPECGKGFYATRNITVTYSTEKAEYGYCKHCGKYDVITSLHSSVGKYDGLCVHCGDKEHIRLVKKYCDELKNFKL